MKRQTKQDWASSLYVSNARVYQPILEAGLKTALGEVKGIAKLLKGGGIREGGRVLDLACGIGRHSVFLAKAGFMVTGVDPSPTFLSRAEELAKEEGVSGRTRFIRGGFSDVLEVLPNGRFAGMILMDGSVGVTAREEGDLKLLKDLRELAAGACVLVVEIFDREALARHYQWTMLQEFPPDLVRIVKVITPPGSPFHEADWSFYRKERHGSLRHLLSTRVRIRQYSVKDLGELGTEAGWKVEACYGDIKELRGLSPEDHRAFVVLRA